MEAAGEYPAETNMGLTEILLILLGILAFIASFIIPENLASDKSKDIKIPEEKIKKMIEQEVKQASFQIEEKTDETISAAAEKTERYMERLSNEKIMAIQEYSDTVLGQINKNHEEAVFLYDMLNNKHVQVKNATAELNSTMRGMRASLEQTIQEQSAEKEVILSVIETSDDFEVNSVSTENNIEDGSLVKNDIEEGQSIEMQGESESDMGSNKSKILKLHEEGKSNIEIAKNLGLGIGEVKLIIDLFESGE